MDREPLQLWLFDEPPVTLPEVAAWVKESTGLKPGNWRFCHYVRHWNIPAKIAAQKERQRRG